MLTNAMSRFLAEKVMGWEPWGDGRWYCHNPGRRRRALQRTPDFATWDGFGLLMTALAAAGKNPAIWYDTDGWNAEIGPHLVIDPDLRVALALAAARAYGWKEEA